MNSPYQTFKYCSMCKRKIGLFRRLMGDKSSFGMIPSNQFCSNKCYQEGLDYMLKDINKRKEKKK